MNFLGIGPGEFFFVILFALLVLGPERLPGFARSLGKSIIRLRNWMNASPDAKVLLQLQQELQAEINEIRSTLREVTDSVRSDVNDTSKNLALTTSSLNTAVTGAVQTSTVTMTSAIIDANSTPTEAQQTIAKPAIDPSVATPNDSTHQEKPSNADGAPTPSAPQATEVVARSSKPNWMARPAPAEPTAPASTPQPTPDSAAEPSDDNHLFAKIRSLKGELALLKGDSAPIDLAPLANLPDSALYAEIRSLNTEIAQCKADAAAHPGTTDAALHAEIRDLKTHIAQLSVNANTATPSHAVSMLQINVEQLSRELKELRTAMTPPPAPAVTSDTIMFLRIELGQLNNRIDELQRELRKTNEEPTP